MPGILGKNPSKQVFLIGLSGWVHHVLYAVLDLIPPPFRTWILKALLKRLGANSFVDYGCFIRYPWTCSIGTGTIINNGCKFYGSHNVSGIEVVIGDHCAIAPNVQIYTAGHDYSSLALNDIAQSVTVGNHVWIGAGAIILPGVKIGEGAVVGAGSVVTRDVPSYTVVAGVPAKVLQKRTLQSENIRVSSEDSPLVDKR